MAIKRATQPFTAYLDGVPRVVRTGDLVQDDDPVLKGRERLFEDVDAHVAQRAPRTVEQATADPGEPRSLTSPRQPGRKAAQRKPPAAG
ncbi:hypothetical protein [Streptomyces sp. UH6]|uniref:hypothetical protein n=1 Tax=Streptomyces sp. UH6 TaxID=2748379 RepID=UPI0015D49F45|nr:hypothetical protein [Streptomyces sp. UH6]NYV72983.1 hypothetical protein [Streptomyces sp. UH6]